MQPCLCGILFGQGTDIRILHDHTRAGIPSKNRVVVARRRKIDCPLVVTHRFAQSMICGPAPSATSLSNSGMSHTLPDDAGVIILLVITLDSSKNFLSFPRRQLQVKLIGSREQE